MAGCLGSEDSAAGIAGDVALKGAVASGEVLVIPDWAMAPNTS